MINIRSDNISKKKKKTEKNHSKMLTKLRLFVPTGNDIPRAGQRTSPNRSDI